MKQTVKPKPTLFPGTTLLTDETHQQKLVKWLPWDNNTNYKLKYKASKEGWRLQHLIFKQAPTVILLRSENGYLFGGYWSSHISYDNTVFIFTLTNPHGIKPTKFTFNNLGYESINLYPKVCFIGGFEVNGQHCVVEFPGSKHSYSYIDTTGKGENLFTGSEETELSDMEVFQCNQ
jgi:hypothetical protein